MTTNVQPMIEQVEEDLAILWFQMDRFGNSRFQEEIEEVSDMFPAKEESPEGLRVIEAAHDIFKRVQAEYPPEVKGRMGLETVGCPHCIPPDRRG